MLFLCENTAVKAKTGVRQITDITVQTFAVRPIPISLTFDSIQVSALCTLLMPIGIRLMTKDTLPNIRSTESVDLVESTITLYMIKYLCAKTRDTLSKRPSVQ